MYYSYYKRDYPKDVLVYIEEFDKQSGTVLFDFIDSNEYFLFNEIINGQSSLEFPSMILLTNYRKRTIRENTIYSIKPKTIEAWSNQISSNIENSNSFLIGNTIDVSKNEDEIFISSVSLNDFLDWQLNYYMYGRGDNSNITIDRIGKLSVTIRNVGQGNWNEINFNDEKKIVYDAGAPMNASRNDVIKIIGDRNTIYNISKPILILSHWDKDHYHGLLGMDDSELENNFSAFLCRDRVPNLTSRKLFARLAKALGNNNIYSIPADDRSTRGGPTFLRNLNSIDNQIVVYNSQHHKDRNISGIVLSIKTNKRSIILPGDAHYEQISRDILGSLNYKHHHSLVVPHHGGKAGKYVYNNPNNMTLDQAIISVGANRYGHPNSSNIRALRKSNFSIHQTNIKSRDITINL